METLDSESIKEKLKNLVNEAFMDNYGPTTGEGAAVPE